MTQARYGGNVTIGKRDGYAVPKGPAKKAPTLARTGGAQPRGALLKPAALVGVHIGKRARSHDPESARQRRLGGAVAASGIGGGALVASGVSDIRGDTRGARSAARRVSGRDVRLSRFVPIEGPLLRGKKRRMSFAAMDPPNLTHGEAKGLGGLHAGVVVRGHAAGKVGAGLGLLGLGATIAGRSHTRRWN